MQLFSHSRRSCLDFDCFKTGDDVKKHCWVFELFMVIFGCV